MAGSWRLISLAESMRRGEEISMAAGLLAES
jgi:hypothetical protein